MLTAVLGMQMKKVLSANAQASLSVESLMNDIDVRGNMTRDDFEQLSQSVLERVRQPLQQVSCAHLYRVLLPVVWMSFLCREKFLYLAQSLHHDGCASCVCGCSWCN